MSYSPPPPVSGRLRMLAGSSLKKLKAPSTCTSVPIAPAATSSLARCHCGWWTTMKPSAASLPEALRAAIRRSISGARSAIGFSHSTCLPARSAFSVHSTCRWLGSGM